MCGIVGFIDFSFNSKLEILSEMQESLEHRGPDDKGKCFGENSNFQFGFAHTRLSILDTSSLGHQPMTYKHLTILLNGEVYNYKEIRDELIDLGHSFISNSDTEVVLYSFEQWGSKCINRFIGMFAFTIFDASNNKLFIFRDRAGVKPLYYYWSQNLFLFASELKSFHKHPIFKKNIDEESLGLFFKHGYIPSPRSIFENCYKLPPANFLELNLKTKSYTLKNYWRLKDYYSKPILDISYSESIDQLEELLKSACNYRMVSDVPVGVFLSGGFDSTLVTSLLQSGSSKKLKTFTIGFPDGINEAPFAEEIAKHLGTDHTSYNCSLEDAKSVIPTLAKVFDEPFSDISAIPTILVSKLAKKSVTVALSADGGDELFAGYNGTTRQISQLAQFRQIPFPGIIGKSLLLASKLINERSYSLERKLIAAGKILMSTHENQYSCLLKEGTGIPFNLVEKLMPNVKIRKSIKEVDITFLSDERNFHLLYSFEGALSDLLLTKVDRATMSVGLEGREPLLDHRLIEFAAQLPYEFKHDGKISKKIIRDIVYRYVPTSLLDRPKTGFDLPIFEWLRGELGFLVEDLLEGDLSCFQFFSLIEIKNLVNDFKIGKLKYPDIIWRLIQYKAWYNEWMIEKTNII